MDKHLSSQHRVRLSRTPVPSVGHTAHTSLVLHKDCNHLPLYAADPTRLFLAAKMANIKTMANDEHAGRRVSGPDYWTTTASSPSLSVMSTASPVVEQYGVKSGGSGYGSGQSDSGKSPLSMSLGFLKTLTEKKTTRGMFADAIHCSTAVDRHPVDGQPPKRRGPKPDSKPALTRRQELNRQAQRYVCVFD